MIDIEFYGKGVKIVPNPCLLGIKQRNDYRANSYRFWQCSGGK